MSNWKNRSLRVSLDNKENYYPIFNKNSPTASLISQRRPLQIAESPHLRTEKKTFHFNSNKCLKKPLSDYPSQKLLPNKQSLKPVLVHSPSSRRPIKTQQVSRSYQVKSVKNLITQVKPSQTSYQNHLFQTYKAMKFIRNIRPLNSYELLQKMLDLPKTDTKKTVVFDLDETLVHCVQEPQSAQVYFEIQLPTGEKVQTGINIRPYAREVLVEAKKDFQVIVFTASHRCYADEVLDLIDPERKIIKYRLYRENCLIVDGVFVKDLRVLGRRRLEDIVIVDNAAYSFAYQLHNGIPIVSWYDDMADRELFKLIDYLKVLAQAADVRVVNQKAFRLDTFYQDYLNFQVGV